MPRMPLLPSCGSAAGMPLLVLAVVFLDLALAQQSEPGEISWFLGLPGETCCSVCARQGDMGCSQAALRSIRSCNQLRALAPYAEFHAANTVQNCYNGNSFAHPRLVTYTRNGDTAAPPIDTETAGGKRPRH